MPILLPIPIRSLVLLPLTVLALLAAACSTSPSAASLNASAAPAVAPSPVLRFHEGDCHRYRITIDQNDNRVIFGRENPIHTLLTWDTFWQTKGVFADGSASVSVRIDRVHIERSLHEKLDTYDSASGLPVPEAGLVRAFAAVNGRELVLRVSPARQIVELGGDEALLNDCFTALGGSTGVHQPEADTIREFLSRDTLVALFSFAIGPALPNIEAPDSEWVGRRAMPSSYSVAAEESYRLERADEGLRITSKGALVSDANIRKESTRETKVTYELLGGIESTCLLNPHDAWVHSVVADAHAEGELKLLEEMPNLNVGHTPTTLKIHVAVESME